MGKNTKQNLKTAILAILFLATAYFVFTPFLKSPESHLEITLPRIFFYTIQTNIFVCVWFFYLLLKRFIRKLPEVHQGISMAITLYISVTCFVYWVVLVPMLKADPFLFSFSNIWMHAITPLFSFWCFMNFTRRKSITTINIILAMIYPILYFVSTFRINAVYGKYPYPFLNPEIMGGTFLVILAFILILALFVALGWVLKKAYDKRLHNAEFFLRL